MLLHDPGLPARDPFNEMRRLQAEMNRLFDGVVPGRTAVSADPPVNFWFGETSVVVTAALPGVAAEDVELSVEEDRLILRGERREPEGDIVWRRRERPTGAFARAIQLPFPVDLERAQARVVDGVLEVELPRPEADLPRRIEIRSS